jgi:hypothetical protein
LRERDALVSAMPRPYHSASSLALGARCERAWAYHYLENITEPELAWADIESGAVQANSRQRGAAIGKALHQHWEDWYLHREVDWTSTVGRIAEAGLALLPDRELCTTQIEEPIGDERTGLELPKPPLAMSVHGVRLAGFRDLVAWPLENEALRLGLKPWCPVLIDYKGTSDIQRWAKTSDQLRVDTQASAYALDVMHRTHRTRMQCRWVYFQTKRQRQALAVDFVLTREECEANLREPCETAKRLDTLTPDTARPDPDRCVDYLMPDRRSPTGWQGGCEYHCSVGGPCEQVRSLKSFFLLTAKLEQKPKMTSMKGKFSKPTNAAPPAATEPEAPPVGSTEPPAREEQPAPAPRTRKPRTPSASPATQKSLVTDLADAKAQAEAKIAEGQAELDAVLEQIQAARDSLTALLPEGGE